jgi:hypothetical protein
MPTRSTQGTGTVKLFLNKYVLFLCVSTCFRRLTGLINEYDHTWHVETLCHSGNTYGLRRTIFNDPMLSAPRREE